MTELHPRGTLRARFEASDPVDAVFRRLGIGARRCDLGDQGLYLAEEIVAADRWLGGSDPEALGFLALALMIALRQGSTRLPLDGPGKGELRTLIADIVKLAGMGDSSHARAGSVSERDVSKVMRRIAALTQAPSFNSVIGSGSARLPLVVDGGYLYSERMRYLEVRVAAQLAARLAATATSPLKPPSPVERPGVALTPEQRRAVELALSGTLTVITGGPGTGKTAVAAAIVRGFEQAGIAEIAVAAPTGKAANRLSEALATGLATPVSAQTIHRLLGYRRDRALHNANHPLSVGALIIDEASMIDLELIAAVLDALPESAPLVLVGDAHQLPAIEAGRILGDLASLDASHDGNREDSMTSGDARLAAAGASRWTTSRIAILEHSHRMDAADPRGKHVLEAARAIRAGDSQRLTDRHQPLATPRSPGTLTYSGVEWVDPTQPYRGKAEPRAVAAKSSTTTHSAGSRPQHDPADAPDTTAVDAPTQNDDVCRAVAAALWHHFDGARAHRIANETVFRFNAGSVVPAQSAELDALWTLIHRARLLTVTRGLATGSVALNAYLHQLGLDRMTVASAPEFVPGEPVMITANDYPRGLWNGDQGIIVRADEGHGHHRYRAVFRTGGKLVPFAIEALRDRLELAWAMTVHKSQGSEFDAVAIVLPEDDLPLLTRELLYTGMTRAKTSVVLCGSRAAIHSAVKRVALRNSGLADRIRANLLP